MADPSNMHKLTDSTLTCQTDINSTVSGPSKLPRATRQPTHVLADTHQPPRTPVLCLAFTLRMLGTQPNLNHSPTQHRPKKKGCTAKLVIETRLPTC